MINPESQTAVRSAPKLPLTTTLGPVRIAVTDRAKALAIWQDVVGLDLIGENAEVLELGIGDKVGSLEAGKYADFLILDPASPLTGGIINPVPQLVASMNAMNIEAIYVRGQLEVLHGKVLDHDTVAVQAEVAKRVARIHSEVLQAKK